MTECAGRDRIKVLHIVESMGGGVFTYLVGLSNELINTCDVYIAYAVRPQTPPDYRKYFDERIRLIEVANFTREISPMKDIGAFFEIRNIAKQVAPDIIHLHSSKAGAIGRFAFCGKHPPLFYTPHGYSFLMNGEARLKRRIYKSIESICGKRRCTTISCSIGEHAETIRLTKRACCINNGINTKELDDLICTVENEAHPFTVFTMGRISYQKNPRLFNAIANALPDVKFVWIGDGELRDELSSKNIEVTGWMDRENAIRRAVNGDVFILTSLWEGLPIALLEAMYMKKVCLVSDIPGSRDVIRNGENGFVCSDSESFVQAIRLTMSVKTLPIVENAYADVMKEYNIKVMAEKYAEVYGMGASR